MNAGQKTHMTHSLAAIDPFLAACIGMAASPAQAERSKPVYARLPRALTTGRPMRHLSSVCCLLRTCPDFHARYTSTQTSSPLTSQRNRCTPWPRIDVQRPSVSLNRHRWSGQTTSPSSIQPWPSDPPE